MAERITADIMNATPMTKRYIVHFSPLKTEFVTFV